MKRPQVQTSSGVEEQNHGVHEEEGLPGDAAVVQSVEDLEDHGGKAQTSCQAGHDVASVWPEDVADTHSPKVHDAASQALTHVGEGKGKFRMGISEGESDGAYEDEHHTECQAKLREGNGTADHSTQDVSNGTDREHQIKSDIPIAAFLDTLWASVCVDTFLLEQHQQRGPSVNDAARAEGLPDGEQEQCCCGALSWRRRSSISTHFDRKNSENGLS
mmetsp:Transcript_51714/g.112405  ORF Transcript_51714/g.112405 Transcript_51714/m.112405 type:complete len:217 (+) Transcript_51714:938-1588(+)